MLLSANIAFLASTKVRVAWTGTPGRLAWIFVNGVLAYGPEVINEFPAAVDLAVTNPARIEVHEAVAEEAIEAVGIPLRRRPLVSWDARADALRYTVYHQPPGGSEQAAAVVPVNTALTRYEKVLNRDLRGTGGTWHRMRVEAVNARGVESVRSAWPVFAEGLPAPITTLQVTGAAGVFEFVLGVA